MINSRAIYLASATSVLPIIALFSLSFIPIIKYQEYSNNLYTLLLLYLFFPTLALLTLQFISKRKRRLHKSIEVDSRNIKLKLTRNSNYSTAQKRQIFNQAHYLSYFVLSIIYIIATIYRYLIIGSVLSDGVTGARYGEIQSGGGGGIYTAISLFLVGAPALLMLASITQENLNRHMRWIFIIVASTGFALSFLSGGRNSFLINAIFISAALLILIKSKSPMLLGSKKSKALLKFIIPLFILFVFYSLYIFIERAYIRSDDLLERLYIFHLEYGFDDNLPNFSSSIMQTIYFLIFYLYFYFTSSFFYADKYLGQWGTDDYLWGGYTFHPFFKLIDGIFGSNTTPDLSNELLINGAYTGLPGTLFIDFGYTGLFLASLLIFCFAVYYLSVFLSGTRYFLIPASFFLMIYLVAPLYSGFSNGAGISLALLSIFHIVVGFLRPKSRRVIR